MGPTAVPVRWVPPLHPRRGLGWFVPRAGGHQNRSVWQEQAKPGHGSVLTGGAGAGALPSQFQGWEHERCRTLPIPDTARQPRAVPG